MQSYFIVVGLVLLGQVGGANDGRYGTYEPGAQDNGTQDNNIQNENIQVDGGAAQQPFEYSPITPRTESTLPQTSQPADLPTGQALFETQPQQQPAGSVLPPASTAKTVVTKPSGLLRGLATPPLRGRLEGAPLSLAEAVSNSRSRAEQTARVEAYWDLSAAVTDYYLAVRAATELDALRQNVSQPGFMWDDARLAFTARIEVARRSAEAAQYHMQSLLGRVAANGLPLPSDLPHSGAYQTRYEKNFAGRPSTEAGQLNGLLPQMYEDLLKQAAAITADQQWLQTVDRQRDPQSDGTVLLKTYELIDLRRQEFIDSVSQYNTTIARYSELASPGEVSAGRLVAMLIGARGVKTRVDSEVTRTSAEEPVETQDDGETSIKTFSGGDRSVTRRESTSEEGVEHSILVKP